jgi:hypothetical protein
MWAGIALHSRFRGRSSVNFVFGCRPGRLLGRERHWETLMAFEQQKPRIVDDTSVGEVYVNRTIGVGYDGATVGLMLGCSRVLPERMDTAPLGNEPPPVHVVARLALSPSAAVELANALNGILADVAKRSGAAGKPN